MVMGLAGLLTYSIYFKYTLCMCSVRYVERTRVAYVSYT
jgi:hypothetical protein